MRCGAPECIWGIRIYFLLYHGTVTFLCISMQKMHGKTHKIRGGFLGIASGGDMACSILRLDATFLGCVWLYFKIAYFTYEKECSFLATRQALPSAGTNQRNKPKRADPRSALFGITHPSLARTRHRRVPIARKCPCPPERSQPRRSGSVANPDWGNGGHLGPNTRHGRSCRRDGWAKFSEK